LIAALWQELASLQLALAAPSAAAAAGAGPPPCGGSAQAADPPHKFGKFLAKFGKFSLVLGCIGADLCK